MQGIEGDRKLLNVVLLICLLVSPVLGVLLAEAPTATMAGLESLSTRALLGLGWGIAFGTTFAICWLLVKIIKARF